VALGYREGAGDSWEQTLLGKAVVYSVTHEVERLKILDVELPRSYKRRSVETGPVVGVDTESMVDGYAFLICDSRGRSSWIKSFDDVIDFFDHPDYSYCLLVAYNLNFDASVLLKWMGEELCTKLVKENRVSLSRCQVEYIPSKYLRFRFGNHWVRIFDVAQFFQGSLDFNAKQYLGKAKIVVKNKTFTKADYGRMDLVRYCFAPDTLILMANLTYKALKDVRVGDAVIGVVHNRTLKGKFVTTHVTALHRRVSDTIRVVGGRSSLVCTPDHPFFGGLGRNYADVWYEAVSGLEGCKVKFFGLPPEDVKEFRRGWLAGYIEGDGYRGEGVSPGGWRVTHCRVCSVDLELIEYAVELASAFGFEFSRPSLDKKGVWLSYINKHEEYDRLLSFLWSSVETVDYKRGWLAGMYDAEGSEVSTGGVIIPQKHGEVCDKILRYAGDLGFKVNVSQDSQSVDFQHNNIWDELHFFVECPNFLERKRLLRGTIGKGYPEVELSVRPNGLSEVCNLTTEVGNYIAGGFLTHNCEQDAVLTQGLGEYVVKAFDKLDVGVHSLASPASVLEGYVLDQLEIRNTVHSVPKGALEFAISAFNGAWFENFKAGTFPRSYRYDLVSAYPSVIRDLVELSYGYWKNSKTRPKGALYGYVRAKISVPKTYISPIMFRNERGDVLHPHGEWNTYLTMQELDWVLEHKGKATVSDGWWFVPLTNLYKYRKVVDKFFKVKRDAKADSMEKWSAKIALTGMYGKFLQHRNGRGGRLYNPVYAAEITSRVRLRVAEACMLNPDSVVAVMSDCVVSTEPLSLPLSKGIGDWEKKGPSSSLWLGPVQYEAEGQDYRFRRIPWRTLLQDEPEKVEYEVVRNGPYTLSQAVALKRFGDIGVFLDKSVSFNIRHLNWRRFWPVRPTCGGDLLSKQYDSRQLHVTSRLKPEDMVLWEL